MNREALENQVRGYRVLGGEAEAQERGSTSQDHGRDNSWGTVGESRPLRCMPDMLGPCVWILGSYGSVFIGLSVHKALM